MGTILFAFLGLACSSAPQDSEAANLYAEYCDLCHGKNGEGYVGDHANALSNQQFPSTVSDRLLLDAIVEGRPGTSMYSFGKSSGGPLDNDQAEKLVSFIREWQTAASIKLSDAAASGSKLRGDSTYQVQCAGCHGDTGGGKTAMSLNNPIFLKDAGDAYIRYAIEHGRTGTKMPGYESQLTSQAIDDLVVLIRSWAKAATDQTDVVVKQDLTKALLNPGAKDPSFTIRQGRYVPAAEVAAALAKGARMVLIDARAPSDYVVSHITGAVSVPYYDAESAVGILPRDAYNIAYCGCPHASSGQVVDTLRAAGYKKSYVLDEGFFVWVDRGYPTKAGSSP